MLLKTWNSYRDWSKISKINQPRFGFHENFFAKNKNIKNSKKLARQSIFKNINTYGTLNGKLLKV